MSVHFVRRRKLSVTVHTWLPRSPTQTSTSTLRIIHAPTAKSQPLPSLTTGESLFELVILLGAMLVLFILLVWLATILLGHAYRFIRDKLDLPRRGKLDVEWAGVGQQAERRAVCIDRKTERAANRVSRGANRAAGNFGELSEEGVREFGRFNAWLVHKTEGMVDRTGEKTSLLSKDGAEDSQANGRTVKGCVYDCGSGTRRRSGVGCE